MTIIIIIIICRRFPALFVPRQNLLLLGHRRESFLSLLGACLLLDVLVLLAGYSGTKQSITQFKSSPFS